MSTNPDTYHDDIEYVSKTQLNAYYDDPDQFKRVYIDHELERPAVGQAAEIGKVVHAWLLYRRPLQELAAPIPDGCLTKNGSINRAKLNEHIYGSEGSELLWLKQERFDQVQECLQTAMAVAAEIGGHQLMEEEIRAEYEGVKVKCKPDILRSSGDFFDLHDIKVSDRIDDRSFIRSARELRYWLQDIHYSATVAANRGLNNPLQIPFTFWTIETRPPYRFQPRQYDEASRTRALEEYSIILERYKNSLDSGSWEHQRRDTITLKGWELKYSDEEVTWTEAA